MAIAADTKVSKTVADITSNGETKKNYDISKNEYEVTFKIQPILTLNGIENTEPLTNATIKLIDTLPKGLKYVKTVRIQKQNQRLLKMKMEQQH